MRFRPQRWRKRIELPVPPPEYYADLEAQKRKAERRMAAFDETDPELRDIINGVGDKAAAISFYDRGVRTTRQAEDLRARIGLLQMEKAESVKERQALGARVAEGFLRSTEGDTRSTKERADAAIERHRNPPAKPAPVVDQKTAVERANSVLARLRGQS